MLRDYTKKEQNDKLDQALQKVVAMELECEDLLHKGLSNSEQYATLKKDIGSAMDNIMAYCEINVIHTALIRWRIEELKRNVKIKAGQDKKLAIIDEELSL